MWRKELTAERKITFARLAQQFETRRVPGEELMRREVLPTAGGELPGLEAQLDISLKIQSFCSLFSLSGHLTNLIKKSR